MKQMFLLRFKVYDNDYALTTPAGKTITGIHTLIEQRLSIEFVLHV